MQGCAPPPPPLEMTCGFLIQLFKICCSFDMYSEQFTLCYQAQSKAFFFAFAFKICLRPQSVTPFLSSSSPAPAKKNPGSALELIFFSGVRSRQNCCRKNVQKVHYYFSDFSSFKAQPIDYRGKNLYRLCFFQERKEMAENIGEKQLPNGDKKICQATVSYQCTDTYHSIQFLNCF